MSRLIRFATAPGQRRLWRVLLAVLLVAITWLALVPNPPRAVSTGWDKSNHALAFASLAFASVWAVWPRPRQWGWLAATLLAYGGAIEIAQSFLPPRTGDWWDLLADGCGIALGLLAAWPVAAGAARQR
ncbi:VanZ family protein [Roseateles sp.]|uniref:VanZ family protein n=1 Tax=Roseateles sp. TaxID=1971397 RepID=UPI0025F76320|nr:VanZ family protein [Roseateles sp.]MBV8035238.1 VanZ family protein [Roseateles sp.]